MKNLQDLIALIESSTLEEIGEVLLKADEGIASKTLVMADDDWPKLSQSVNDMVKKLRLTAHSAR
jgi:hypothetical protein